MPKVLIVAYHFPPEPAAGALRPGYLARYLSEFGWEPVILTRDLGVPDQLDCPIVTAPVLGEQTERWLRRQSSSGNTVSTAAAAHPSTTTRSILRWLKQTISFPDRNAGWIVPATIRGIQAARAFSVDAVLSTAPPPSAHLVAAAIAGVSRRPWIADFRDLWYGNPTSPNGPARKQIEKYVELFVLKKAARITTISAALADRLQTLHRRPVVTIANAQDPSEWQRLSAIQPRAFELCYTGSMYDGARTPELLFQSLAALRNEGDPAAGARVHFYGPNSEHVRGLAERYGVAAGVEQHGTVLRPQALAAQRAASDLLIFLNMDPSTSHELGSKVFEYAGARRPILAFGPRDSVMRNYLTERDLGWFAADVEEAKAAVRLAWARWAAGDVELEAAEIFGARDLAKSFSEVLGGLLQRSELAAFSSTA